MIAFLVAFVVLLVAIVCIFCYPLVLEIRELMKDVRKLREQTTLAVQSASEMAPHLQSVQQRLQNLTGQAMALPDEARQTLRQVLTIVSGIRGARNAWNTVFGSTGPETALPLKRKQASLLEAFGSRLISFLKGRLRRRRAKNLMSKVVDRIEKPLLRKRRHKRYWLIPAVLLTGGLVGTALARRHCREREPHTFGDTF